MMKQINTNKDGFVFIHFILFFVISVFFLISQWVKFG